MGAKFREREREKLKCMMSMFEVVMKIAGSCKSSVPILSAAPAFKPPP